MMKVLWILLCTVISSASLIAAGAPEKIAFEDCDVVPVFSEEKPLGGEALFDAKMPPNYGALMHSCFPTMLSSTDPPSRIFYSGDSYFLFRKVADSSPATYDNMRDRTIIATVSVLRGYKPSRKNVRYPLLFISNVCVDSNHRGFGLVKPFIRDAISQSRQRPFYGVDVSAAFPITLNLQVDLKSRTAEHALRTYAAMGFLRHFTLAGPDRHTYDYPEDIISDSSENRHPLTDLRVNFDKYCPAKPMIKLDRILLYKVIDDPESKDNLADVATRLADYTAAAFNDSEGGSPHTTSAARSTFGTMGNFLPTCGLAWIMYTVVEIIV